MKLIVEEEIENQTAFDEYVDRLNEVTADLTIVDKTFIKHEQIELEDVEDTMTIIEEDIDNLTLNDERKTKLKEKMKKLYREAAELS